MAHVLLDLEVHLEAARLYLYRVLTRSLELSVALLSVRLNQLAQEGAYEMKWISSDDTKRKYITKSY